ncbi:unnamed protein product [Ilex paraguariensis]|uniref:Exonuclease domain-containing protein n=1 Tax=Ilex paraguariensis TaxID=185542 RepID=A0ABC8RXT2_9AQUA
MRTVAMCFSLLQVPRCRIHTLATSWWESFHNLRTSGDSSSLRILGSNIYGPEGGHSRRWNRRPVTDKTEGRNKSTLSRKTSSISHQISDKRQPVTTKTDGRNPNTLSSETSCIRQDISDGTIARNTKLIVNESETSQFERLELCDIQQSITENKDLAKLITVIVFDIETTGLSRKDGRIIEIALRDLSGGENSTFQTLVNPERYVPNSHIHGISTHMVNRPDVPRYSILQFLFLAKS